MRDGGAPQRRQKGSAKAALGLRAGERVWPAENANARVWIENGAKAAKIVDGRTSWLDPRGTEIT